MSTHCGKCVSSHCKGVCEVETIVPDFNWFREKQQKYEDNQVKR